MIKADTHLGTIKYSRRYVAVILLFLCLILFWYAFHHYSEFKQLQLMLMKQSVQNTSAEITATVAEQRQAVKVFSNKYIDLIQYLALNPEDEKKYDELKKIVQTRFPDSFAYTIADSKGEVLLGNYDLQVNELCQLNIKQFVSNSYQYDIFIHPNPEVYHYDIMTIWQNPNSPPNFSNYGVFFISFNPNKITRILKNAEVHNHELFLLKNDIANLIEISSNGNRILIPDLNGNFFLNEDQISRIGYKQSVSGTRWDLVDIPHKKLFSRYREEIIIHSLIIMTGFIVISFIFLALARYADRIRLKSEAELEQIKFRLEQALSFSNLGMWEYDIVRATFLWSKRSSQIFQQPAPTTFENYINLISEDEQQRVRDSFYNCIKTGLSHRIEHKIKVDGNTKFWLEITGNIETNKKKCATKMIGLVRDITTRKLAEENRISFEIQQKNASVREVHHRIKNNLQGVVGLLRQHSKYASVNNTMLDHAVSQLNSVSLVHGIQCDDINQRISVAHLVNIICKATLGFTGVHIEPNITSSINEIYYINEKNAVPVALISNELIFNATKHSTEQAEKNIHIDITTSIENISIKVQNDGAFLPNNFDFDKSIGLGTGLSLVKSLLPRQGATLSFKQLSGGVLATFTLTKPVLLNQGNVMNDTVNKQRTA